MHSRRDIFHLGRGDAFKEGYFSFKEGRCIQGGIFSIQRGMMHSRRDFFSWDKNKAFLEGNIFEEFKEGNFLH